jgi:hypothetical protein
MGMALIALALRGFLLGNSHPFKPAAKRRSSAAGLPSVKSLRLWSASQHRGNVVVPTTTFATTAAIAVLGTADPACCIPAWGRHDPWRAGSGPGQ